MPAKTANTGSPVAAGAGGGGHFSVEEDERLLALVADVGTDVGTNWKEVAARGGAILERRTPVSLQRRYAVLLRKQQCAAPPSFAASSHAQGQAAQAAPTKTTTATKAKETTKAATKPTAVRLSEADKAADPENYILNPATKKHVKRDSPMGKKLAKAEETGEEVAKTMTETARLVLFIQTLVDQLDLEDSAVKAAFTAIDTVKAEMPRAFPAAWGGKSKSTRHPDHPKQPSNPFIYYNKANRAAVVEANPGVKNTEIISILSKMWKDTADEDRAEYNELAAQDKIRYEEEMRVFEAEHPELARAKNSPGDGRPTKETAYRLFCEDHREEVQTEFPDLDGKAITKKLADKWAVLKKEDKAAVEEYEAKAEEANKDFAERVKEYQSSPGSKKLSKVEQAKADDPEHYELNVETGRYMLKEGWTKNPDGSFTKKEPKASSPKTSPKKTGPKSAKPAAKPVRAAKTAAAKKVVEAENKSEDDDLVVE